MKMSEKQKSRIERRRIRHRMHRRGARHPLGRGHGGAAEAASGAQAGKKGKTRFLKKAVQRLLIGDIAWVVDACCFRQLIG